MKEIRDVAGNFLGFEGSECQHYRGQFTANEPNACDCTEGQVCRTARPCDLCFALWRAENEQLREALEEIVLGREHGTAYPRCDECAQVTPEHEPWCAAAIAREALEGIGA